ncbi:hypothetical protein LXL04_007962 [Taraxacum kok-saghyz]
MTYDDDSSACEEEAAFVDFVFPIVTQIGLNLLRPGLDQLRRPGIVNDPVEVYGREEDRCLCFYAATIVSLFETDAEVRFADLKTEDNKPIIEKVGLQYLRPRPVNFSLDFKCGDAINVWIKDRWWLAKFVTSVRRSQATLNSIQI